MKVNSWRATICVACALALAGCDTFGGVGDTVSGWFSATKNELAALTLPLDNAVLHPYRKATRTATQSTDHHCP